MTTLGNSQLPPPANWEEFEALCCDLWRAIHNAPTAQRFGRAGQAQHGVDIYLDTRFEQIGIQCKTKDRLLKSTLTRDELRNEVEKAKKFRPPLTDYFVATTTEKDADIETYAAELSRELQSEGSFRVTVVGWRDLLSHLDQHLSVARAHFGRFFVEEPPSRSQVENALEHLLAGLSIKGSAEILIGDRALRLSPGGQSDESNEGDTAELEDSRQRVKDGELNLNAEIDSARDLLVASHPTQALERLEAIRSRAWENGSNHVRFRILTNIGAAYLYIGDDERAARYFLDAYQYEPDNEIATRNRATAYWLKGNRQEAKKAAQEIVAEDVSDEVAHGLILDCSENEQELREAFSNIPRPLRRRPQIAAAMVRAALNRKNFHQAALWAAALLRAEGLENHQFSAFAGSVVLQELIAVPITSSVNQRSRKRALLVHKKLTEFLSVTSDVDLRAMRAQAFMNRALTGTLLGEPPRQISADYDASLSLNQDNETAISNYALFLLKEGEAKRAKELMRRVKLADKSADIQVVAALVDRDCGDVGGAIKKLECLIGANVQDAISQKALHILAEIYIETSRFEEAENTVKRLNDTDPMRYMLFARLAERQERKTAEIIALLNKAEKAATGNYETLVEVGNAYGRLAAHEQAIRVYEALPFDRLPEKVSTSYAYSLVMTNRLAEALITCESYGKSGYVYPELAALHISILESLGELSSGLALADAYLEKQPEDFTMALRKAALLYRTGERKRVSEFIESVNYPPLDNLAVAEAFARLCGRVGNSEKAVEVLYQMRRHHYDTAEAHYKYVGLLNALSGPRKQESEEKVVKTHAAVELKWEEGITQRILVESQSAPSIDSNSLREDNDLIKVLMGLKKDDTFSYKTSSGIIKCGVVLSVDSKYAIAFRDSLEKIQTVYADERKFKQVKITQEVGGAEALSDEFVGALKSRHELVAMALENYRQRRLPIATVADVVGRSIFDTLELLAASDEFWIWMAPGDLGVANALLRLFGGEYPELVMDLTALWTAKKVGLLEAISRAGIRPIVPQSSVDYVENNVSELRASPPAGFMGVNNQGLPTYCEVPESETMGKIRELEALAKWMQTNVDIRGVGQAIKRNPDRQRHIGDIIGQSSCDAILLAREPGRVLWSDDQLLRDLARNEFSITGIWSQIIGRVLVGRGIVDVGEYNDAMVNLIVRRYSHVSVSVGIVSAAAEQSKWNLERPLNAVLERLGVDHADYTSACRVVVQFWKIVVLRVIMEERRRTLIQGSANFLLRGRDRARVIAELDALIKQVFVLLPLQADEIMKDIRSVA